MNAWMWLMVSALNLHYLEECPRLAAGPRRSTPTAAQGAALKRLRAHVLYLLRLDDAQVVPDVKGSSTSKFTTTYDGETVMKALPLSWPQMEPSLPPAHSCARGNVLDLADGPIRELLLHPEWITRDLSAEHRRPKPGKLLTRLGELARIARGLLERGLVRPLGHVPCMSSATGLFFLGVARMAAVAC